MTSIPSSIIIIGAARSGTNMLRDQLTQIPGYGTWPCDEINYIWRHGNIRYPSDEFNPDQATPAVQSFIRAAFNRIVEQQGIETVVEKTCANSLRVGFIDRIFPDARYIFIVRDGRDVVSSAMKRWAAPLDIPYILRKARYVPVTDLPYYALRYLANRIHRLSSNEKRLASWGPRFEGMQEMLRTESLAAVCAMQWRRSVERAEDSFASMDQGRIHRLRYEDFVEHPAGELIKIARFLGIDLDTDQAQKMSQGISASSVGNWKKDLKPQDLNDVLRIGDSVFRRYGYI